MHKILFYGAFIILVTALSACSKTDGTESHKANNSAKPDSETTAIPGTAFRKDAVLNIISPEGKQRIQFDIEIAASEKASMQGLMYRESMQEHQAMLFDPQGLSRNPFWMKNTYIPLDIIFIDEDSRIMHIAENTHPFSEDRIEPGDVYRYVLETNAGITKKYDLKIGDRLEWKPAH